MIASSTTGAQVAMAMSLFYLLLAVTSAGVGFKTRARPHSQLRLQVNAWWWIFPIVSISLLIHPLGAWLLAGLIALLAARELAQLPAAGAPFRWRAPLLVALLGAGALLAPGMTGLLLALAALVQAARYLPRRDPRNLPWLLLLLTCCGVGFLPCYQAMAAGAPDGAHGGAGLAWLFYLYLLTALNDVAQFISGSLFGKQKIAPAISPNKTWQGLAGGVAVTLFLSVLLGGYLHLAPPARLAGYGVLLSLGGFAGDLLFSAAKRRLAIKDFSQLIPGHGGMLDRVDSLVVTAPLLYLLIHLAQG